MAFGMRRCGFRLFAKELIRVREAPLKRFLHLFPHLITTYTDGRTDHGKQASGLRTIHAAHLPHGLFDDARQHSAPPGMNRGHGSTFRVCQQHGQAIGSPHRQQDTRLIGQQRITSRLGEARLFWHSVPGQAVLEFATDRAPNLIYSRGMDLLELRQREVFRANLL